LRSTLRDVEREARRRLVGFCVPCVSFDRISPILSSFDRISPILSSFDGISPTYLSPERSRHDGYE
jgi:hypothetical protein